MAQSNTPKQDAFQLKHTVTPNPEAESIIHSMGKDSKGMEMICDTESRGHSFPNAKSKSEIVLDASEGFIPLWERETTLRWRFRERSLINFANPAAAKEAIKQLLGEALEQWGDAAPVKFTEDTDVWDFEIVVRSGDQCSPSGCVLASAFFPDAGQHELTIYPKMFTQSREEQVETLIHEIGHVFGLRHFFAKELERGFPAEIFGKHTKFSIMNYGELSILTENDRNDLKRLYQLAWTGRIKKINGTPIKFVRPFHTFATVPDGAFAIKEIPATVKQLSTDDYIKEFSLE
jgi:hypothetical protein